MINSPATILPNWSTTYAVICNDSSDVICPVNGVTSSAVGLPGVTVIVSLEQINPKHAVIVWVPAFLGVNNPNESMLPSLELQVTGAMICNAWWLYV